MNGDINVLVFFKSQRDDQAEVLRFASMAEAVSHLRCENKEDEFGYVHRIEVDTETGIANAVNVDDEFETAWIEAERNDLYQSFTGDIHSTALDRHLDQAVGPQFRKYAMRRRPALMAAE
ncbi:MAG: hypothetical protein AB7O46_00225 [Xanthobacteraceae bacterium]